MIKRLFTQNDPRWRKDIMTAPPWQQVPDYLGRFGCLITAAGNAYNLKYKSELTPGDVNRLLIEEDGYKYLKELDKCPRGQESFVCWEELKKILDIVDVEHDYQGMLDINHPDHFYIARAEYQDTGHYCLIVGGTFEKPKFFDSYSGNYRRESVTRIIRITFNNREVKNGTQKKKTAA